MGKEPKQQEISWDGEAMDELDTVLVKGKRVPCSPGLRFTDEEAIKLSRRSGWIFGFGKIEDLDCQGLYLDWVTKAAMEPRLHYFANSLLKLEEGRTEEKIRLNEDQRKQFAEDLCAQLVSPTGLELDQLVRDGYFVMKKLEELRVTSTDMVETKKREFADLNALPPIIFTPLAMKELTHKNDVLEYESVQEKSSICFNPVIKNMCSTGIDSQIHQDYEDLVGELSNISLDHDITIGTMQSLMDQSVVREPDPEDVSALTVMLDRNVDKAQKAVQKMKQHKAQLATARNNLEEQALNFKTKFDALNCTIAERNKAIAKQSAEMERIQRDIEMVKNSKDQEISELNKDLQRALDEAESLKKENRAKVDANVLFQAEDDNFELQEKNKDLQEKLDSQNRRQKGLQARIESLKIDTEAKLESLKHENKTLAIKKENLEKTLKEEKRSLMEKQEELEKVKAECETLQLQNDSVELSINRVTTDCRRLSSNKNDFETMRRSSSNRSDEVFNSPAKFKDNVSFVKKMVAPNLARPDYIMSTDIGNKDMTKTVSHLLPKWSAGEDIRNYTKRLQHAWKFVKGDFDEKKFCNLVRISVSANLGEIIDNYLQETEESAVTLKGLCETLNKRLDKCPSEYITEFKMATKGSTESYSAYAHRLRELYKKGTGMEGGKMGPGEKRLLVEQFLEGVPFSESATLKLVATDEEMLDVDALALRASRSGKRRRNVTSVTNEESLEFEEQPMPTDTGRRGAKFDCHFCGRYGHGWRACFQRAREDPDWDFSEK